jgi:hypothetical protein
MCREDDQLVAAITEKEMSLVAGKPAIDVGLSVPESDRASRDNICSPKDPCGSGDALEASGNSH